MSNKCNFEEWEVNSYSESRTCNSITCHLGELGSILPKNIDKGSLISREGISAYKQYTALRAKKFAILTICKGKNNLAGHLQR